jgi:hypothetical protein
MILVWAIVIAIPLIITDTSTPTMLIYWLMCTPAAFILWFSNNSSKPSKLGDIWCALFTPEITAKLCSAFFALTILFVIISDLQFFPPLQPVLKKFLTLIKSIYPMVENYYAAIGVKSRWFNATGDQIHILKAQTAITFATIIGLGFSFAIIAKLYRIPPTLLSWSNVKSLRGGVTKLITPLICAACLFLLTHGTPNLDEKHVSRKTGRGSGCFENFICWSSDSLLIFEMAWLQMLGMTILPAATVVTFKSLVY